MHALHVLSTLYLVLAISGCASVDYKTLHADGAEASAFCVTGGPGGTLGIGPSGIVTGAKANAAFQGLITVDRDCSINLEAK